MQRWVAWYRQGGRELVRTRQKGGVGQPPFLNGEGAPIAPDGLRVALSLPRRRCRAGTLVLVLDACSQRAGDPWGDPVAPKGDRPRRVGVGPGAGPYGQDRAQTRHAVGLIASLQPGAESRERSFEELRRQVEGVVYSSLDDKVAAVAKILGKIDADPERVRSLAGWDWINDALEPPVTDYAA